MSSSYGEHTDNFFKPKMKPLSIKIISKVDVVILNWNTGIFLQECVQSVIDYGYGSVGKIIVVDNDSTDDSLSIVEKMSQITLIKNKENYGTAKGWNIGANFAESEYILFLNPDARVYKDTLRMCLDFLNDQQNQDVGIMGVNLHDAHGEIATTCSRFPSTLNIFSHATGLDRIIPSLGQPMKEFDHLNTRLVDQTIGAFFFLRKNLFDELTGFDERFFVYYEEIDFCYRAKLKGWKTKHCGEILAFHHGEVSSSKALPQRLFYHLRSKLLYIFKNFSFFNLMLAVLLVLIVEPIPRFIKSFFQGGFRSFSNTFRGYSMLVNWCIQKLMKQ